MRRLSAILIGLLLTLAASAQAVTTVSTAGGLTIDVPDRYLASEIGPLRVGLTDRVTGASLIVAIVDPSQSPDEALAAEFRRLGIGEEQVQFGALSARAEKGRIVGARAVRASGSLMIATISFADGALGLLTMQPADSVPLPILKSLVDSVRLALPSSTGRHPLCGSEALPQALTTSGGLSVCFPAAFAGEEKGADAAGVADLSSGVLVSIYARADLESLVGSLDPDVQVAALSFADGLRIAGAEPVASALETFSLSNGSAAALPVAYPGVGSGRVIAVQTPDGIVIVSAVLLGLPPAGIVNTLNAIANSVTLGTAVETGFGTVRPAETIVDLGVARLTAAAGWSLLSLDGGIATLARTDGTALMSIAAAPGDSAWNATAYKANVLPVAAQFAGDAAFDPAALEVVTPDSGMPVIELYDSSVAVPDSEADVNLTALVTLEGRAMIVLQITATRAAYSADLRGQLIQMAASVH
jgi:hypothetical protein